MNYDLIVIGSGPGGYVAAIRGGAVRIPGRCRGARGAGWHLPELGMYPHKVVAEIGTGAGLCPPCGGLRRENRGRGAGFNAIIARSRGVADKMSKGIQYLSRRTISR